MNVCDLVQKYNRFVEIVEYNGWEMSEMEKEPFTFYIEMTDIYYRCREIDKILRSEDVDGGPPLWIITIQENDIHIDILDGLSDTEDGENWCHKDGARYTKEEIEKMKHETKQRLFELFS